MAEVFRQHNPEALSRAAGARGYDPQVMAEEIALRDGGPPGPADHMVTEVGKEVFRGTERQCGVYLFQAQGHSSDWAMRYGGWAIVPIRSERGQGDGADIS